MREAGAGAGVVQRRTARDGAAVQSGTALSLVSPLCLCLAFPPESLFDDTTEERKCFYSDGLCARGQQQVVKERIALASPPCRASALSRPSLWSLLFSLPAVFGLVTGGPCLPAFFVFADVLCVVRSCVPW